MDDAKQPSAQADSSPEQERQFQERLEHEKLASLAEFAAGAGHEINNPLAVIVGRAQLLMRDETQPDRRRDLATIAAQAMRIHEMIADLMLFARPPEPVRAECDLSQIIDTVLHEQAPRAESQGTELRRIGERTALPAQVDGVQISIALRALIDNALEALVRAGSITVSGQLATVNAVPSVVLTVIDDGPGIPPEVRRHIFDPFYSGREAGRGLGTGLSKCWRIVTNHGGSVAVDSALSSGACFTITLPCRFNDE